MKGHPHFHNVPCPACGESQSIDVDMDLAYFVCASCGTYPINPYSKTKLEVKTPEEPKETESLTISEAEIDFIEYLIKEGRL